MPSCQAYGCGNTTGKTSASHRISYYRIPHPSKEKNRAKRWLHNIGTGHNVNSFKFTKDRVVCSDHFHENCFQRDLQAELLDYVPRKRNLKPGAIPTIFNYKTFDVINMDGETVSLRPLNVSSKRSLENDQHEVCFFVLRYCLFTKNIFIVFANLCLFMNY